MKNFATLAPRMPRSMSGLRVWTMLAATGLLVAVSVPTMADSNAGASNEPPPVAGGKIGTLTIGKYACELPGDAGGKIGEPVPEYDFSIVNASSYKAQGIRGSYLYTGDTVVMTGGKLKGLRFQRVSAGFLRELGEQRPEGPMRCIMVARRY